MPDHEYVPALLAEIIRGHLREHGTVSATEPDFNDPPGGTLDYPGRAQAFLFTAAEGRTYRVLVEDVTIEEEVGNAS